MKDVYDDMDQTEICNVWGLKDIHVHILKLNQHKIKRLIDLYMTYRAWQQAKRKLGYTSTPSYMLLFTTNGYVWDDDIYPFNEMIEDFDVAIDDMIEFYTTDIEPDDLDNIDLRAGD